MNHSPRDATYIFHSKFLPVLPCLFYPLPGDDPNQRKSDITLAKNELGWEPQVVLSAGFDATVAQFGTRIDV